jgi:hypothetical protein
VVRFIGRRLRVLLPPLDSSPALSCRFGSGNSPLDRLAVVFLGAVGFF